MIDLTRTTSALLNSLRDPANEAAWNELDGRYRPILFNLARRAGLADADAADAAQETLAEFFGAYRDGKYDRSRGRLRQYMLGIARRRVADVRRARARPAAQLDGEALADEDDAGWEAAWEAEKRADLLRKAIDELRASERLNATTLAAFEMAGLRHVPVAEVARSLSITEQEVYLAKSRCLQRVRTLIERLQAAYDDD
jgi:RNA polymerase sigma factor (sigma-70 family)